MASPADIRKLGYEVAEAKGGYRVVGYGVDSFFTDADLEKFADPAGNAERVKQYEEGPPVPQASTAPSDLDRAVAALETLDQSKAAIIGDVVAVLRLVGSTRR